MAKTKKTNTEINEMSKSIKYTEASIGDSVMSRSSRRIGEIVGKHGNGFTVVVKWADGNLEPVAQQGLLKLTGKEEEFNHKFEFFGEADDPYRNMTNKEQSFKESNDVTPKDSNPNFAIALASVGIESTKINRFAVCVEEKNFDIDAVKKAANISSSEIWIYKDNDKILIKTSNDIEDALMTSPAENEAHTGSWEELQNGYVIELIEEPITTHLFYSVQEYESGKSGYPLDITSVIPYISKDTKEVDVAITFSAGYEISVEMVIGNCTDSADFLGKLTKRINSEEGFESTSYVDDDPLLEFLDRLDAVINQKMQEI